MTFERPWFLALALVAAALWLLRRRPDRGEAPVASVEPFRSSGTTPPKPLPVARADAALLAAIVASACFAFAAAGPRMGDDRPRVRVVVDRSASMDARLPEPAAGGRAQTAREAAESAVAALLAEHAPEAVVVRSEDDDPVTAVKAAVREGWPAVLVATDLPLPFPAIPVGSAVAPGPNAGFLAPADGRAATDGRTGDILLAVVCDPGLADVRAVAEGKPPGASFSAPVRAGADGASTIRVPRRLLAGGAPVAVALHPGGSLAADDRVVLREFSGDAVEVGAGDDVGVGGAAGGVSGAGVSGAGAEALRSVLRTAGFPEPAPSGAAPALPSARPSGRPATIRIRLGGTVADALSAARPGSATGTAGTPVLAFALEPGTGASAGETTSGVRVVSGTREVRGSAVVAASLPSEVRGHSGGITPSLPLPGPAARIPVTGRLVGGTPWISDAEGALVVSLPGADGRPAALLSVIDLAAAIDDGGPRTDPALLALPLAALEALGARPAGVLCEGGLPAGEAAARSPLPLPGGEIVRRAVRSADRGIVPAAGESGVSGGRSADLPARIAALLGALAAATAAWFSLSSRR